MPDHHDSDQIKADAASASAGNCPECGKHLDSGDGKWHVVEHWPRFADLDPNLDAARRARLVLSIDTPAKGK
jgi:hypothetical protein